MSSASLFGPILLVPTDSTTPTRDAVEAGADLVADGVWGSRTRWCIRAFQEENELPGEALQAIRPRLQMPPLSAKDKSDELDIVRDFLDKLRVHHNYQCARYDGDFQGTEVGMTLFYTDLLMKLWSFAQRPELPAVAGFAPETEFPVPAIYWDEIKRNPATRGWLGGRLESVTSLDREHSTIFEPIATRLYNAASSPLFPGKEVPANFSAERFSSWWNAHYRAVADYEPQYHRLNQIMKWSAALQSVDDGAAPNRHSKPPDRVNQSGTAV